MSPGRAGRGEITVGSTVECRVGLSLHIPTSLLQGHALSSVTLLWKEWMPLLNSLTLGPQAASEFYQFEVTGLESRDEDTGHGLPLD